MFGIDFESPFRIVKNHRRGYIFFKEDTYKPKRSNNMFSRLQALYDTIDSTAAQIASDFSREVKCKKGCSDCCHAAFDVSLIEAYYILNSFRGLPRKVRRQAMKNAGRAMKEWEQMVKEQLEISTTRIRCPLLDGNDTCIIYEARPVNCRTYGVPTEIKGEGHVCRLSGFKPGMSYPTIKLLSVQKELLAISEGINPQEGKKRWPVAAVLLSENTKGE